MEKRAKAAGFTLIELLVVVAIVGIIAAIAVPNLLLAMQRAKQRRTMVDMRDIATAWEARATEIGRYNAAGGVAGADQEIDVKDLSSYLAPTYIREMPVHDAWSKPFLCFMDQPVGSANVAQRYALVSGGHDETVSSDIHNGPFTDFDCDIVYANGLFLSYPEGTQVLKQDP